MNILDYLKKNRFGSDNWLGKNDVLDAAIGQIEIDAKRIATLEEKAKIASELINYVMGADDYETNYKDDDCIYTKHFKDLVSINRFYNLKENNKQLAPIEELAYKNANTIVELQAREKVLVEALQNLVEDISKTHGNYTYEQAWINADEALVNVRGE